MKAQMDEEAIRYQWYVSYDREHEYGKDPDWASDLREDWEDPPDDEPFADDDLRIYDRFDPEHIWIRSDETVNLMDNL